MAGLGPRHAVGLPWPGLAHPMPARLVDDREHAETLQQPCTWHLQESSPGIAAGQRTADEMRTLIRARLGVAVEILDPRHAQDQSLGFDHRAVGSFKTQRSEERSVGKECGSTCRARLYT